MTLMYSTLVVPKALPVRGIRSQYIPFVYSVAIPEVGILEPNFTVSLRNNGLYVGRMV